MCPELDRCNELIEKYWKTEQYEKCFSGYLPLAEQGYPLAECQIGYFYLEGRGVEKDVEKAFYWTERAAIHGDWDGQFNLASFYEEGIAVPADCSIPRSPAFDKRDFDPLPGVLLTAYSSKSPGQTAFSGGE